MGTFVTVLAKVVCPRCLGVVEIDAQCKLGESWDMPVVRLGDPYPLPADDPCCHMSVDGGGYAECPGCELDFGVRIHVVAGVVAAITPEPRTLVHMHDAVLFLEQCPGCGEPRTTEVRLYNGVMSWTGPYQLRMGDPYPAGARHCVDGERGFLRGRAYCGCRDIFAVCLAVEGGRIVAAELDPNTNDAAFGITC